MIGIVIHTLGLLTLIPHPRVILDLSMLIIDILVVYGLIKKTTWGYYLAIVLYLQQSIMQPYWGYLGYVSNFFIVHPAEHIIAPMLVMLSLLLLIANKNNFVHSTTRGN